MPMFNLQLVNKANMERIIWFTRNRKLTFWTKGMFFGGELRCTEAKTLVFVVEQCL